MNTATITQAQDKGLRHQFADIVSSIRTFAIELYAAHGGWFGYDAAQPVSGAIARRQLMNLAKDAEVHSPSLAAELRSIASK
jgi:hypothetical protein